MLDGRVRSWWRRWCLLLLPTAAGVSACKSDEDPTTAQVVPVQAPSEDPDREVNRPGGNVTTPRLVRESKPQYTPRAMQEKIQGEVLMECVVKADGTVGDMKIVKSLHPDLDQAALDAASHWLFEPGTRNGKPVNVLVDHSDVVHPEIVSGSLAIIRCAMPRRRRYGTLPDGTAVDVITLGRPESLELDVLTYGCIITSLAVPDAVGLNANVVLGFDRLEQYVESSPYFGAVVGRYANRIAHGRFAIDGREHHVSPNDPPHHLHGGFKGFDKRVWDADVSGNGAAVVFRRSESRRRGRAIRVRSTSK